MNERDIRNAFEHLKEDVMSSVKTEERLEQITQRKTWVRPAFLAFAGAAAVALIIGAAVLAFRPDSELDPVPPATGGPTTVVNTTVTPTTAPPTTNDPGTTLPWIELPDLISGTTLVAGPDGVTALTADGPVTFATDLSIDMAVGDAIGGVFVQTGESIGWLATGGPNLTLLDPTFAGETGDRIEIRLEDVTVIEGDPTMIFIVAGGVDEGRYEEVWRYDMSTATPTRIYRTGAYEGGIRRASLQNDVLVVTRHAEGFSWLEFFDADGRPIDTTNPKPDGAEFPVFVDQAILSPDGATLVFLESDSPAPPEDNNWRIDLVVWDVVGGVEDRRMEIELGNWYAGRMDYDGIGVVIGRIQWNGSEWVAGPPLHIASLDADAGIVEELDVVGTPSLVKIDLR